MSKIDNSKTQGKTDYIECLQCEAVTKHTVERALEWSEFYEGPDISALSTYQIVRCNGCDALSFRIIKSSSEEYEPNERGDMVRVEREYIYPERAKRFLVDELYLRDDIYAVPQIIQTIYRETLSAVQHDLPTLAGIGIRAVIEAICQDQKTKKRNLADKIDELVSMSLLTPSGAKILHSIRLLGNYAAHEMKAPKKKQITAALKVLDHLLLGVYVLPQEASVLPKPEPKTEKKAAVKKSPGAKP